ncbi:hypothetical protein C8Q74DRAFT_992271 [Fomes fomentarius]|nr:hypothetical protein C8Q74DRAFT_992271 [Fomes fomentarius]
MTVTAIFSGGNVRPLWRSKPKASDSPLRASRDSTEPAKQTLVQGYDYASMILSERPFLDFVYGLFFCGNSFCLARFDRCNIALSAMYDIYNPEKGNFDSDGLRIFIRIMLRMLWEASAVELGFNTAVKFAPTNPPQTFYQAAYPQFIVTMGFHGSTEEWHTYGPPLWASPSAVASRGSWIWRTMDDIDKVPVILKVAWRSEGRMGERDIYLKIEQQFRERGVVKPPGMVQTSGRGGDVYYAKGKRLSVAARRDPFFDILEVNGVTDRVLHLVSIVDFGKSLWKYSGTLEFALTMSEVIEAHKILCKNGILHRDVSAGNILINVNAKFQPETVEEHAAIIEWDYDPASDAESLGGFLADFEFASFEHSPTTRETIASGLSTESHLYFTEKIIYDTPRERGDGLTGTPTFMATELLRAITTGNRIHRTARQDLESFAWVILYAIYRHTLDELPHSHTQRREVEQEFIELFAATSAKDIIKSRGDKFLFGGTTAVQTLLTYITGSRYHHLKWLIKYAWDALEALQPRQEETDGPPDEDQSDDARFSRDHLAPISLKRPKPTHPVEHDGFLRALGFIIEVVKRDMEAEKQKAGENLAAEDVGTEVALDSERRQWLGRKMTGPQVVA